MQRSLRFVSLGLSVTPGLQTLPLPAVAFSDVKASTQYSTAIEALQSKGVLEGYANGTFKPSDFINRAEFVKVIASAAFDKQLIDDCVDTKNPLKDVPKDAWFAPFVCVLRSSNAVSGYPDGTFRPGNDINFAEAAKILASTYGQTYNERGEEWYVPTVRLLESAKAIPASVVHLDSELTRGEMAEMIWRLTEKRTDQPTKGLLNLQNPSLSINTASDDVQYPQTCGELQAFATSAQASGPSMYLRDGMMMENAAGAPAMGKAMAPMADQSAQDYSQTNVQVDGVDEADIVKTDGTFLYVLSNREKPLVRIVRAVPPGAMKG